MAKKTAEAFLFTAAQRALPRDDGAFELRDAILDGAGADKILMNERMVRIALRVLVILEDTSESLEEVRQARAMITDLRERLARMQIDQMGH